MSQFTAFRLDLEKHKINYSLKSKHNHQNRVMNNIFGDSPKKILTNIPERAVQVAIWREVRRRFLQ